MKLLKFSTPCQITLKNHSNYFYLSKRYNRRHVSLPYLSILYLKIKIGSKNRTLVIMNELKCL